MQASQNSGFRWARTILGTAILLALIASPLAGLNSIRNVKGAALQFHNPISIRSNADFTTVGAASGCKCVTGGTGTLVDPYLIQGWEFDLTCFPGCFGIGGLELCGSTNEFCAVEVKSTTAYFVLSGISIHDGGTGGRVIGGVYFGNVQNGALKNSNLVSNVFAIQVEYSSRNLFDNNQISNDAIAVSIAYSSFNTFSSNTVTNSATVGFQVLDSSDNRFLYNTMSLGFAGFHLTSVTAATTRNLLAFNTVGNVGQDGFFLNQANGNRLEYNNVVWSGGPCADTLVFTCPDGYHLESASDNVLVGNVAANDPNDGFLLELGATRNLLENNIAHGSVPVITGNAPLVGLGAGFASLSSDGNTYVSNVAYGNDAGFDLSLSSHNRYSWNVAYSNGDGFDLFDSSVLNEFDHNQAWGSQNWGGFYLDSFDGNGVNGNTLVYNVAHDNVAGIRLGAILTGVDNNTVTGNIVYSNNAPDALAAFGVPSTETGIVLDGATNSRVFSNIVFNNPIGISTSGTALGGGNAAIVNNFLSNTVNAVEAASNDVYNVPSKTTAPNGNIIGGTYYGGNFWSDYTGADGDADGIGDTPYVLYAPLPPIVCQTYPNLCIAGYDNLPLVFGPASGPSAYFVPLRWGSFVLSQGSNTTLPLALVSRNGYSDTVTFSATVSPTVGNEPQVGFSPASVHVGAGSTNATAVTVTNTITPGTYSIVVTMTSSTYATTVTIPLTINPVVLPSPTITSVSCSPSSVVVNLATSCTATVLDVDQSSSATPTGTIAFSPTGSCTLTGTGNTASCSIVITPLTTGTLSVSATYQGDSGHDSSSGSTSVTVLSKIATSTTVSCPSTGTLGVAVTCTVTVTDTTSGATSTPSGTVSFTSSVTGQFSGSPCTLSGSGTSASCTVQYTPQVVGSHQITGSYSGDSSHAASQGLATITLGKNPTAVTATCTSVVVGQSSTCSVTVTDTSTSGATTPTGTVTILLVGTCALSGSGASSSCQVPATPPGAATYSYTVNYSGDSTHGTSTGTVELTSTTRSTSTSTTCSPSTIVAGSATTCTVTVTDTSPGTQTAPTGTVTFSSSNSGSSFTPVQCSLTAGGTAYSASCSVTYTSAGAAPRSDLILGAYGGDSTHATSSNSFQLQITALQTHPTATTVSCNPSTISLGQSTQCTIAVADTSSNPSSPTGNVAVTPGGSCTLIGSGPTTTCTVTINPTTTGSLAVTANYGGDSAHVTSSGSTSVTVTPVNTSLRSTSTSLVCTPSALVVMEATSCVVTVTDIDTGTTSLPTGTVSFSTGGTSCALSGPVGASATCSVTLTVTNPGTLNIIAYYQGDSGHKTSSGSIAVTVNKRPTSTVLSCVPITIAAGGTVNCMVTVIDSGPTTLASVSPSGTVTFSPGQVACALVNKDRISSTCTINITGSTPGTLTMSASYGGDASHAGSTDTVTITVNPASKNPSSTIVSCVPQTAHLGETANCTVTVTDASSNPTMPFGLVSFTSDEPGIFSPSATCVLQPGPGSATCSLSYSPSRVGPNLVTVNYSGDSSHQPSQASITVTALSQVQHSNVVVTVNCSPSQVTMGDTTSCNVTVTGSSPTGQVSITMTGSNGGSASVTTATCTLSNGSCTIVVKGTSAGSVSVTASYSGDSYNVATTGSTSLTVQTPSNTGQSILSASWLPIPIVAVALVSVAVILTRLRTSRKPQARDG